MKKTLVSIFCIISLLAPLFIVEAYVSVKGYFRSDGTYVKPHVRSNPNGIKFDNYSWKPSQGLYNPSYGTRGSSWDTPAWTTDPDYYKGKSLYDSGNSSIDTNYIPSRTYSPPSPKYNLNSTNSYTPFRNGSRGTRSTVTNCPKNSYYSVASKSCKCSAGYTFLSDGSYCVKKNTHNSCVDSINGYYDTSKDECYCKKGYKWSDATNKCLQPSKPLASNSYTPNKATSCAAGYKMVNNKCTKEEEKPSSSINSLIEKENLIGCGLVEHEIGNYNEAIECYSRAIEIEPNNALWYELRALVKLDQKEYWAAILDVDKSIELDENNAITYYISGKAKSALGYYKLGITDLEKSLKLDFNQPKVHFLIGAAKMSDFQEGGCNDMEIAKILGVDTEIEEFIDSVCN